MSSVDKKIKVLWIGGWAADLEYWQREINQNYPNCAHTYVSVAPLLTQPFANEVFQKQAAKADILVAWSLGSLWWLCEGWKWSIRSEVSVVNQDAEGFTGIVHPNQTPTSSVIANNTSLMHKPIQVHLVAPITHFCARKTGWKPQVLVRMRDELYISPRQVLSDFSTRACMPIPSSGTKPSVPNAWTMSALSEGLLYLEKSIIHRKDICHPVKPTMWVCENDAIAPPLGEEWANLTKVLPAATHFPFFTHAQTLMNAFKCNQNF